MSITTDKGRNIMTATKTRRPSAPVTVKQGKPSAPGTKVDTSAAKVVPPSPEVRVAEDAAKSKAKVKATVGKAAAKMTAAAKPDRKTKLGHALTKSWPSAKGQEVKKGDTVKLKDGTVGVVDSRFTMQQKDARVPYVGVKPKDGGKGKHVPSAEVQHTK